MMNATVGGETYQVVGTASLADLEAAQVVVSAQPGTGATATQLHYITDDGHTAAEWLVLQECPQVLAAPDGSGRLQQLVSPPTDGSGGDGTSSRCLVCRSDMAVGWPVQSCFTKHGRVGFLALLMDILLPGGEVTSGLSLTCGDHLCEGCAALLNDVDEYGYKLRSAQQQLRDKYKLASLDGGAAIVHQITPAATASAEVTEQKEPPPPPQPPPSQRQQEQEQHQPQLQDQQQPQLQDQQQQTASHLAESTLLEQAVQEEATDDPAAVKAEDAQPAGSEVTSSRRGGLHRCPLCPRRLRSATLLASHVAQCRAGHDSAPAQAADNGGGRSSTATAAGESKTAGEPSGAADGLGGGVSVGTAPGGGISAGGGGGGGVAAVPTTGGGGAGADAGSFVGPALACHCGEQFSTPAEVAQHHRTSHAGDGRFFCEHCAAQLKTPKAFVEHMRQHGETRPFRCEHCDKRFTLASSLRTHRRLHTGDKPYQCELCGRAFSQHTSLQSHKRTHTNQRPHTCDVCHRGFRELHALKKHKLIHSGEKPFQCELCDMRFRQKGVLQRHLRTHTGERPYRCDQCDGAFIDSGALKMHKIQHTGQKPFYCEHCGKGFSDSFWFNKHQMYHNGERPFQCDLCPKAFTDARILRNHKKLHSGERPYICYVCGARFSNSSHLTRHNHIHTGARPFECEVCRQSFRDKSTLKRHMQTHTCRRTLDCPDCGRSFPRKDALAAHRRQPCSAGPTATGAGVSVAAGVTAGGGRDQDPLELAVSAAGPPGFGADKPIYSLKALPDGQVIQLQGLEQLQPPHQQQQQQHLMQTYQ